MSVAGHCKYNEDCCSFCGKPSYSAEWRGNVKLILVCRECAFQFLPALFADATWHPDWRPGSSENDLDRFRAVYWRAQALNISNKGGAS